MEKRRNPAIAAGLIGAATLCAPLPAQALPIDGLATMLVDNPSASFFAGAIAGAVASGIVSGFVCHGLIERDRERWEDEHLDGYRVEDYRSEGYRAGRASGAHEAPAAVADAEPVVAAPAAPAAPQAPRQATPGLSSASRRAHTSAKGSHATDDYEQIAQNYVGHKSLRARMATRAQGVAQTLRERVDAEMMDGLPVIARADGSVADVGTSWWNTSVGLSSIAKVEDYVAPQGSGDLAIPSHFSAESGKDLLARAAKDQQAAAAGQEFMRDGIEKRVAFVDEGVYPEVRDADDSFADDDWASALKSMDERFNSRLVIPEPVMAAPFEDIVGDADTLDEPDGLEQSTSFIPFKPLAGHPEVVDAETYVNHLIEEEFGKNSSTTTRKVAGRFLRLLEGGTSAGTSELRTSSESTNHLHLAGEKRPYRPKHFAPSAVALAKEA